MKKLGIFIIVALLLLTGASFAQQKQKVTFYWALYDGLNEEFRAQLEKDFNVSHPNIEVEIVPIPWDLLYDKITTAIVGGNPPEITVSGTRWIIEFMKMGAIEEVTKYVSQKTLGNISPGAMEAKIGGKLMGLPIAAGARILAYNADVAKKIPGTMEELREEAIKYNNPPNRYGLIMPGKKHTELTDFAYYLYAAGGDFFEEKPDGSYGKCIVNSPAGVKALTFMVDMATKDKIVPEGFLSVDRMESHPIFYAGKAVFCFIGAWVESAAKQAGATFKMGYDQIPPFEGQKQQSLIITDSIVMFKNAKNLKAAGEFLDFFYQDKYKAKFDELIGFPPVTISASELPQFQTPFYKTLSKAAMTAKGWPLIEGWEEFNSIIWDANVEAFLGRKTPQQALDDAAGKIDEIRGIK